MAGEAVTFVTYVTLVTFSAMQTCRGSSLFGRQAG
jgi:hypothetical protein